MYILHLSVLKNIFCMNLRFFKLTNVRLSTYSLVDETRRYRNIEVRQNMYLL